MTFSALTLPTERDQPIESASVISDAVASVELFRAAAASVARTLPASTGSVRTLPYQSDPSVHRRMGRSRDLPFDANTGVRPTATARIVDVHNLPHPRRGHVLKFRRHFAQRRASLARRVKM